ncbi:unnamed protein product [Rotaria sordida]|uniref:Uncharacterized protein n=1 Tax=Rotaria sordida TaxID=392033 RepID=A0A814KBS9_9BILA|nr:unnamed protein product [Rotaria sordida]CAF3739653.1 unnamed protein product [Rotaria sordida]
MGKPNSKVSGSVPSFDHIKSVTTSKNGRKKNIPRNSTNKVSRIEKTVSLPNEKLPYFVENAILIWLDSSLDKQTESNKNLTKQFYRATDIVQTFFNIDDCFNFINSIKYEKIFLIVSGALGQQISSLVENLNQVHSIYIFCGNKSTHEEWTKRYTKINSIHTKIKELYETVKKDIRQYDNSLTPVSILQTLSTNDLDDSNKEFIYLQMMKSVLVDIQYDKKFRKELISYSRQFYLLNEQQLNIIDTFDASYHLHSPIWWYTRRCFIYSMLRKAFYCQDFELIYKLAFFVRDLHREIKKCHLQSHSYQHRPIIVYRATSMTNSEFENVEKSLGSLLSFKDFLIATLERNIALRFVNILRNDSNVIGIIYRITIDPLLSSIPYIALNHLSYLSNTDGNILLSMNTIFRIDQIEQIHERFYEINLIPATKKDEEIKNVVEFMQETLEGLSGWYKLCKIMLDMKQYNQVENILKYLYNQIEDNQREERAFIQHELGYVCELKDNLIMSINHYKQAIDIYLTYLPSNHSTLLSTYINLASVLHKQGDLNGALQQYRNALKIDQTGDQNIAIQHNNIGKILQQQKKYSDAQKSFELAVDTLYKNFQFSHPILADTYYNMASMFYSMKDYSNALIYNQKTLDIEEKSIQLNQSTLASTYFNIATTYEGLKDEKNAIQYATKAVESARLAFGNDHLETKENLNYLEQLQQKTESVIL